MVQGARESAHPVLKMLLQNIVPRVKLKLQETAEMNLKKAAVSLFAATAISFSLLAPMVSAEDVTNTKTSNVDVTEAGDFTLWVSANVTLDGASVSTTDGQTVSHDRNQVVQPRDTHASSDGYVLQLQATDLESGDYSIEKKHLSVTRWGLGRDGSCLANNPPEVHGGNEFQKVDVFSGSAQLSGDVQLVNAEEGRGCGQFGIGLRYTLDVPEGTHTGGDTASYQGSLIFTTVAEPGDK